MKYIFIFIYCLVSFCSSAQILNTRLVTRPIGTTPSITTSVSSLTGFSTNTGIASTSQSFTVSGFNLLTNAVVTAPTNYEVSLDNSTFAVSRTITQTAGSFPGQPVLVYVRITSSAANGSVIGNVTINATPASQSVALSGTVNTTSTKDSARFQFDSTSSFNRPGWVVLTGDPHLNVKTGTGGINNTITITTVSTDVFHWTPLGNGCTGPNTGITNSTIPNYDPGVMKEAYFCANGSYNASSPQFIIGGLNPTKTYDLQISGSTNCGFGLATNGEFRVKGSTLQTMQTMIGQCNGSPTNPTSPQAKVMSFPIVQPDGSGNISIYMNPVAGQQIAVISYIILYEH